MVCGIKIMFSGWDLYDLGHTRMLSLVESV